MKDFIGRTADLLDAGYATPGEIREILIRDGLTKEQAFLTFVAGRMIHQDRENHRKQTAPTLPRIPVEILP